MRSIAIIPARGGSKRIPRKNIKEFLGKPIIAYSIEAALNSGLFDEVMVSTDDEEIALLSQQLGAQVPFLRSAENANDFATTVDVLIEVIGHYENAGKKYEYGCCLYPTVPFITSKLLEKAKKQIVKNGYDCVFPILPFTYPIQRALKLGSDGRIELFQPEFLTKRSQDLTPAFHDSGQFYWFSIPAVLEHKTLWTKNTGALTISEMDAHDIDNLEDWKIAEFKYKAKFGYKEGA
ncbi:MAG: pseudaminic acid cytidylyltransferase [Bacteroidota bacterium]|nr:pseudaminic acid cytidylyltransferase [Bacteroidota bacterium]